MAEIGDQLGPYRLDHIIGRGGFAVVYRATHAGLATQHAVKVLKREHSDDTQVRQLFQREARRAARLSAEHVVQIFDAGETDGEAWLSSELMTDGTLAEALQAGQQFSPAAVRQIGADLAHALEEAHSQRLLHRDVKPANVFLKPGGGAKLGDFGVAAELSDHTHASTMVGTLSYMAPEQDGGAASEKSDIYGLGVVMFEAWTGARPPALARLDPTWPPLTETDPDLRALVSRTLAVDAASRPNAREVIAALSGETSTHPPGRPLNSNHPIHRVALAAGALALLATVVGLATFLSGSDRGAGSITFSEGDTSVTVRGDTVDIANLEFEEIGIAEVTSLGLSPIELAPETLTPSLAGAIIVRAFRLSRREAGADGSLDVLVSLPPSWGVENLVGNLKVYRLSSQSADWQSQSCTFNRAASELVCLTSSFSIWIVAMPASVASRVGVGNATPTPTASPTIARTETPSPSPTATSRPSSTDPVETPTQSPVTTATQSPTAAVSPTASPTPTPTPTSVPPSVFGPGVHLVRSEIAPGIYTNSDTTGFCSVKVNDRRRVLSVRGPITLEIVSSDSQVEAEEDCGTWSPFTPSLLNTFGQGYYFVTSQIAPGTYRHSAPDQPCTVYVSGKVRAQAIRGPVTLEVHSSDSTVEVRGCGTLSSFTPQRLASFGPGFYLVGSEIAPGTYTNSDTTSYCSVSVNQQSRIASLRGALTLEIRSSDATLEAGHACGTWTAFSPQLLNSFGPGLYLVGSQVAPGTYANSESASACTVSVDGTTRIGAETGSLTLEILTSDSRIFSNSGCGTWTRSP